MCGELDGFGDRAATGASHHARRINVGGHERIEQGHALVFRH
jgi:hypothetical protein